MHSARTRLPYADANFDYRRNGAGGHHAEAERGAGPDAGGHLQVHRVLRRNLTDWLKDMGLVEAGAGATLDRYIGYFEPYATSHVALDADAAVQEEVRNVARALVDAVHLKHAGRFDEPGAELESPRPK